MLDTLRRDYSAMAGMIFGAVPPFDEILASMSEIDALVNSSARLRPRLPSVGGDPDRWARTGSPWPSTAGVPAGLEKRERTRKEGLAMESTGLRDQIQHFRVLWILVEAQGRTRVGVPAHADTSQLPAFPQNAPVGVTLQHAIPFIDNR